mgnify:CR=1 FL=1
MLMKEGIKMTKAKSNSKPSTYNKSELLLAIVFATSLGIGGYLLGNAQTENNPNSDKVAENLGVPETHMHSMFEVPADNAPTVSLIVTEDKKSGYNIKIVTTNFRFAPENVNGVNVAGEGHAHLYVGAEKIGRVYGPDFHYSGNFEGTKTFRVTLNANDHSDYTVNGRVIEASQDVSHDSSSHNHEHMHKENENSHNM